MNDKKLPCPSCTWRGPVWLDAKRRCVYCETTYQPGNDDYAWIWRVVPLGWWLEEGMIKAEQIPSWATDGDEPPAWDDPALIADFFTGPESTGKEPYEAFGEWAKEHGYNVEDEAQLAAAIEAYGGENNASL